MRHPLLSITVAVLSVAVLTSCATDTPAGSDPATSGADTSTPDPSTTPSGETSTPQVPVVDAEATDIPLLPGVYGTGYPAGVEAGQEMRAAGGTGVARTSEPGLVHVFTAGSSSCPPVVESTAVAEDDGSLFVAKVEIPPATPCTMDFRPFTSVVALPSGVDPEAALTFHVATASGSDEFVTVELPVDAGPGDVAWAAG
ncbi:hypothetical protein [Paraoerskovia marina]|uniref:hypothetical protein n=1 Tax=Paraoerskovia marina TaxID=545619 RepID=UPI0005BDB45C|nr:hypothetical protein [Paraoerskovia marina]